jgi:glycosyltransferase involved in cell wall biosynthesis
VPKVSPLRVLVVHNRYSSRVPSGENLAVDDEVRWLADAGVDVHVHTVSNDDVVGASAADRVRQAALATWSIPARRHIGTVLDDVAPDVVHLHNLFPLLTGSVADAALRRRLPVVWTVHNHRVLCVAGTNFRDGHPCHQCRPGWRLPGIRHACYGESSVASALVTGATSIFRQVARRRITAVAISHDVRRWLVETARFATDRVVVKYNGVAGPPQADDLPDPASNRTFLFAGHLSEHKGVPLLLDAWQRADLPDGARLHLVGDGPLADEVRAAAAADARIAWTGHVPYTEMPALLAEARAAVVPSVWEEPFGRSAAEALAYGRPVVTTGTGGLSDVVDEGSGWITGTDTDALAKALVEAATSDAAIAERAGAARRRHLALFSPEATTRALLAVYESARTT